MQTSVVSIWKSYIRKRVNMLDLNNAKISQGIFLISFVAFLLSLFALPFVSGGSLSYNFFEVLFDEDVKRDPLARELSWFVGISCVCYLIAAIFTVAKVFEKRFRAQQTTIVIGAIASVAVMVVAYLALDNIKTKGSFGISWWFFYAAGVILIVQTIWPKFSRKKNSVEEEK